ncbi:MAG: Chromosomal replication initiator protein DnaA [Parcubacteria group bacterium GW2011_GWB1_52_7]|nr:MAG: Chromosomal replication initiator protein DnaA [Parcubacteria group bacterium GW2011_GWA1_51_12]KKW29040.1 MAG: Chromosomal replication initiator protein DnaA [Parcubacteria group bacterium GW2011_GWB1_52_7]KKW31315.1 MAG: Chromosomal replication initiator protein DnaA [Parcubacteria group bacterium GW2011_GWC2_52_8c]
MTHDELWQNALTEIELNLTKANFITWFKHTAVANVENGVVTLSVPNGFAREWLQSKYHKFILRAVRNLNHEVKDVNYIIGQYKPVGDNKKRPGPHEKRRMFEAPIGNIPGAEEEFSLRDAAIDPATNLNPRYTFESFIVGSFNELAHAAAQSVIKNLGGAYNPLFIYGGVGLGKTHLIQAVGNEVLKQDRLRRVLYVPTERFMGEVVEALSGQSMGRLKDKYRSVDLLIIDDVQFIGRTEKMQEEFFHIFNNLYQHNKQILVSSDRPPKSIPTLEERLRSRFEGGMIADIGLPDRETRMMILKNKVGAKGVIVPDDALWHIADSIKTNIRELEGALNRVVISSKLSNNPISLEETKKILSHAAQEPRRFTSLKKIMKAVSEFYDVSEKELIDHSRRKEVVRPRQITMYLLREDLKSSFPFIGEKLGKKDHTTVIHACKKITKELKDNPSLDDELHIIRENMYS